MPGKSDANKSTLFDKLVRSTVGSCLARRTESRLLMTIVNLGKVRSLCVLRVLQAVNSNSLKDFFRAAYPVEAMSSQPGTSTDEPTKTKPGGTLANSLYNALKRKRKRVETNGAATRDGCKANSDSLKSDGNEDSQEDVLKRKAREALLREAKRSNERAQRMGAQGWYVEVLESMRESLGPAQARTKPWGLG